MGQIILPEGLEIKGPTPSEQLTKCTPENMKQVGATTGKPAAVLECLYSVSIVAGNAPRGQIGLQDFQKVCLNPGCQVIQLTTLSVLPDCLLIIPNGNSAQTYKVPLRQFFHSHSAHCGDGSLVFP